MKRQLQSRWVSGSLTSHGYNPLWEAYFANTFMCEALKP